MNRNASVAWECAPTTNATYFGGQSSIREHTGNIGGNMESTFEVWKDAADIGNRRASNQFAAAAFHSKSGDGSSAITTCA
jgi:hypothetical protein